MLERSDIQGLVLSGYASSPRSRFFLLRFRAEGARPWLGRILPRITTGTRRERHATERVNVGFTATGLRALGLSEEALATFPREFVQGMADPERSRVLGDLGVHEPGGWEFGGSATTRVDAVVLAYAATEVALDELSAELEEDFERFGIDAREENAYLPEDQREHFGFRDGLSNVRLGAGLRLRLRNRSEPRVPPGEFVLGYLNAYGRFPDSPSAPIRQGTRRLPRIIDARRKMDLGENGTFLVLRKLAQDVAGFWRFAAAQGNDLYPGEPAAAEHFASLMIGRTLEGTPLARERCPVGAHIRRANPRDALGDDPKASLAAVRAHRLIRRGRSYGPPLPKGEPNDQEPRGLLFLALCANIRRQFEFVQESWLNNPKLFGLTHERDPLVGSGPLLESADGRETFSVQTGPVRRRCSIDRFVTVRGGAYLFMPGVRGLAYLAEP